MCLSHSRLRTDVLKLQFSLSTIVTRYITIKTKLAAISDTIPKLSRKRIP